MDDLRQSAADFVLILVGNKTDLKNERVVSFEEGENLAKKLKVQYVETSIYVNKIPENGMKIHDIIYELAKDILKRDREVKRQEDSRDGSFKLQEAHEPQKKSGCRC